MWWWALPAALLVGAAVWGVSAWLLQDLGTLPVPERISARIEAVRTALAAGAGVGAAVTLLLAVRRQRHQELATAHTTHDAAERRVTELYTKAAEQLGNAQAPVRLAGLYALERLAQDTPALRQTIVDVICSYLRMPYVPPPDGADPAGPAVPRAGVAGVAGVAAPATGRDPQEERQVRLTAQRILAAHLRYDNSSAPRRWWPSRSPDRNPRHWPDIRLDLTGAVLINFDLSTGRLGTAQFGGATFTGDAAFDVTTFTRAARFDKATFTGAARFGGAHFTGDARFGEATFTGEAAFDVAAFTGDARFDGATFTGDAAFDVTTFTGDAAFDKATFTRTARFGGAHFTGDARFGEATFAGAARFGDVTFAGNALFGGATFTRAAWFGGATFTGDAAFDVATFTRDALFGGASGLETAVLIGACVAPTAGVQRVWPPCWRTEEAADGWQTLRLATAADGGQSAEGEAG